MTPQPIDTAPKDGTRIMVFDRSWYFVSWSNEADFGAYQYRPGWQIFHPENDLYYSEATDSATHWMPSPEDPT